MPAATTTAHPDHVELARIRRRADGLLDRRRQMPVYQVGVAAFSEHDDELNQEAVVRLAVETGMADQLVEDTSYDCDSIRKRLPGKWALAFLAFANSATPDIKRWWTDSSAEVWKAAGFTGKPSYDLTWKRFDELEAKGAGEAFFEASCLPIRLAITATGGMVGFDVHVDGTESESHARVIHDCRAGERCPGWGERTTKRDGTPGRTKSGQGRPQPLGIRDASGIRAEAAKQMPDDESAPLIGDAEELVEEHDDEGNLIGKRVRVAGHWFRITDPTAGVRTQTGSRAGKLVDHFAGEPLVTVVESASVQEYDILPEAYERLKRIFAGLPEGVAHPVPRSVVADKGPSINRTYELLADDGVFCVMPHRGPTADALRTDRDDVARCENCGGEAKFVSATTTPHPRIMFECIAKPFAECAGRQQLAVAHDPRHVLMLWRTEELYQALDLSQGRYERAHRLARQRNSSGGKHYATRPKRKGRDWQQMRAHATTFSTWLKICRRNGWLDGATTHVFGPVLQDTCRTSENVDKVEALLERRRRERLHQPYGPRARALGVGPLTHVHPAGVKAPLLTEVPAARGGAHRRKLTPLPATPPEPVPAPPVPKAPRLKAHSEVKAERGPSAAERERAEKTRHRRRSRDPLKATSSGREVRNRDPGWDRRAEEDPGPPPDTGPPEPPLADERPF
jgi:hypothetical protein